LPLALAVAALAPPARASRAAIVPRARADANVERDALAMPAHIEVANAGKAVSNVVGGLG
jgi:hypothetical protein